MNLFVATISQDHAVLNETESHHLAKVLRLKKGDKVLVTDGVGNLFEGEVAMAHPKQASLNILQTVDYHQKRDYFLHIAVAPTKQIDRIEWFVEKAVEVGVDEVSFIESFHSERRNIKIERLERVAVSAMKQSLKAELPKVNDLCKFMAFIEKYKDFNGQKFIAHCNEGINKEPIKKCLKIKQNYLFLIGPEGDFSEEEVNLAIENGFTSISLGNQRMRTETAALSTAVLSHWLHQYLSL